jgi:hypothetical protein
MLGKMKNIARMAGRMARGQPIAQQLAPLPRSGRGQAAVEFLTTYGWALLVIAIVLVTLGWLGVFTPQNVVKDYCNFPVGTFGCVDALVTRGSGSNFPNTATDVKSITLENNFGRDVAVCGIFCSQQPANPNLGYPSTGIVNTVVNACRNIASAPQPSQIIKAGEKWTADNTLATPCIDINNNFMTLAIGSQLNAKLYVAYKFTDESGGYKRMIVGDISAKVQPNN